MEKKSSRPRSTAHAAAVEVVPAVFAVVFVAISYSAEVLAPSTVCRLLNP